MSFISNLFNRSNSQPEERGLPVYQEISTATRILQGILDYQTIDFSSADGSKLSAVIICSKILAQDIGRLPLKIFKTVDGNKSIVRDDFRYRILHDRPNNYTDAYSFWSAVEFTRNFEGNAYVLLHRDLNLKVESLEIIPNAEITKVAVVNGNKFYFRKEADTVVEIPSYNILHFKNISYDTYLGRDPRVDLALNNSISYKALKTIDNFYNNGAITTQVLESTIPSNIDSKEWQKKMADFEEKYKGYANSSKVISLPPFVKLSNIPIDFESAQFIETIKYTIGQVANYYGIPAHRLGVLENSKFNNLVEIQSEYTSETIGSIVTMYRRELEFKLLTQDEIDDGYSIEFETGALLITDSKTRMENYKSLFERGAITPNKIAKLENLPSYEGGDDHYMMTNYMSIENYHKKNMSSDNTQKSNNE